MTMQKLEKVTYIGGNGDDDRPSQPDRRPGEGNDPERMTK